jgi:hypothetical protein
LERNKALILRKSAMEFAIISAICLYNEFRHLACR